MSRDELLKGKLNELGRFLADLNDRLVLPDQFTSLLPEIKRNLISLSTAQSEIQKALEADINGNEPSLGLKRFNLQREISKVEVFYKIDLPPKIKKLYDYLLVQPNGQDWAEQLRDIKGQNNISITAHKAGAQNMASASVQVETYEGNRGVQKQYSGEVAKKTNKIPVSQDKVIRLRDAQRALYDYVYGYTNLRQQIVQYNNAKFLLIEGRHKDSKEDIYTGEYWEKINNLFDHASMLMKEIPDSFITSDDIPKRMDGLTELQQSLKEIAASPEDVSRAQITGTISQAISHIERACNKLDRRADKCKATANKELQNLDILLTEIFNEFKDGEPQKEIEKQAKAESSKIIQKQAASFVTSKKFKAAPQSVEHARKKGE